MAGFTKSKLHILSLLSSLGLSASAQPQKFETITVSSGYNVGQMLSWRVILEPALALDSRSRPNYRSYGEENNQEIGNYKVGLPDEMDFAFQWDLSETRSKKLVGADFSFQGPKQYERLNKKSSTDFLWVDRVFLTFSVISSVHPNNVFEGVQPTHIFGWFYRAVNDSLKKMPLLPNWKHGGFASPECTGTRKNGPALMMQFIYDMENGDKLNVNVDLVLAIDLREIYDGDLTELCVVHMGPTWQQELLKEKKFLDRVLVKVHDAVLLDSTFAERIWLSTMDFDHPVKTAVRLFKILNQMALQHPDPNMTVESALFTVNKSHMAAMKLMQSLMAKYRTSEQPQVHSFVSDNLKERPVKQFQYFDMKVPEGKRFADVGECLGYRPYFKSHVFQSVILALYALRCVQNPDTAENKIWSKDDLQTIVANVMMIVQQFLDKSVDKDPDAHGSRNWGFCEIQLESEGGLYCLPNPKSLCLDVYRGDTVKKHFARMRHLFEQLTNQQEAHKTLGGYFQADTSTLGEASQVGNNNKQEIVRLLTLNVSENKPEDS